MNRNMAYLRVSYTERCNLRCKYCMPAKGIPKRTHEETLSVEALLRLIQIIHDAIGIRKVRITGGEPLVRKGILKFIEGIAAKLPNAELAITTNGILLDKFAERMKLAGIQRVNVSVDTIDSSKFSSLTRGGTLNRVLSGIEAATRVGFPVKTNTVLMNSINRSELCNIVRRMAQLGVLEVRFIELMRIGEAKALFDEEFFSTLDARAELQQCLDLRHKEDTATGFRYKATIDGSEIYVGFITTETEPFCDRCDRLRLDSAGRMRPCLLSPAFLPLGQMLRDGKSEEEIARLIAEAWSMKHEPEIREQDELMSVIGG